MFGRIAGRRGAAALAALLALVAAGAAAARWAITDADYARLLTAQADTVPARRELMAFAVSAAAPVWRQRCAVCHGPDLRGDPRLGVPDLTDRYWLYGEGRVSEIEQTITHGIRSGDPKARNLAAMPAFGEAEPYARYHIPPLNPPQTRDLVEYLLWLRGRPADAAAAARGGAVFHANGGCYDCHGQDAAGDGAIGAPGLREGPWLYGDGSRRALLDTITHGRAGACPAWIGRLPAGQIRALALFVFAHAARAPRRGAAT